MPNQKILLVDDEPLVLRSLQKTLERAGFDVETAGSSMEGLQVFQAAQKTDEPFTLAVLDMNIPNFEGLESAEAGLELLSRIKECEPTIKVIVLSAYDEVNKAKEAIRRGALSYCVKGREQVLLEQIRAIG